MMKPPFLNGSSSAVRLRVPSGKIRNELPARIDAAPASIDRIAASLLRRSTGMKPPMPERARQERNRVELRLVEDVHPRVQRVEQDRRIDVALMVGAVHRGAVEREVLAPATRYRIPLSARPSRTPPWPRTYRMPFQPEDQRQQHADAAPTMRT